MGKIHTLMPCEACPMTDEKVGDCIVFLRHSGKESDIGRAAMEKLEEMGIDPETAIKCIRLDCERIAKFRLDTSDIMGTLAGMAAIIGE